MLGARLKDPLRILIHPAVWVKADHHLTEPGSLDGCHAACPLDTGLLPDLLEFLRGDLFAMAAC